MPSGFGIVAGAAWLALQLIASVRSAGVAIPQPAVATASAIAAALAVAAAVRTASWAWRGPPLPPFPTEDVARCAPAEADAVRAAAQLRGTMGGAGHVHRARLAFPAVAWALAAASALAGPGPVDAAPWVAVMGGSAAAAVLFPARAFFYREASGGRVVVHPPCAVEGLLRASVDRPMVRDGRRAP